MIGAKKIQGGRAKILPGGGQIDFFALCAIILPPLTKIRSTRLGDSSFVLLKQKKL